MKLWKYTDIKKAKMKGRTLWQENYICVQHP